MNLHISRYIVIFLLILSVNDIFADAGAQFYENGDYEKALVHYRDVTKKRPDQWQGYYNLGAAAYKAGQINEAVEAFEKSLATDQSDLREKAFYNLGNSYYRMGEASEHQGPMTAIPVYEKALGGYQSALELNPEDEDAKFNAEFVRQRIEELKQQQEQQQKQNSDSDDDSQDQQEQEQEQADQQEPNESSEDSEGEQDQAEQQQEDQANQEQEPEQGEQEDQENSADPSQEAQANSGQVPLESTDNFDKTRAGIFLDTLQEDEKTWNFFPELQAEVNPEPDTGKDW